MMYTYLKKYNTARQKLPIIDHSAKLYHTLNVRSTRVAVSQFETKDGYKQHGISFIIEIGYTLT